MLCSIDGTMVTPEDTHEAYEGGMNTPIGWKLCFIVVIAWICATSSALAIASSCEGPVDPASFYYGESRIVGGFLGQRLYLYTQPPGACNNESESACKMPVYIVTGDTVSPGGDCDDWTAIEFDRRKRKYFGWVKSNRLVRITAKPPSKRVPSEEVDSEITYPQPKSLKAEKPSFVADANLCEAVRQGSVEDVTLDEITPIPVEWSAWGTIVDNIETGTSPQISLDSRGLVDLDNNGRVKRVAMAHSFGGPVGQGTRDFVWEWPVVLDEHGFPDLHTDINMQSALAGGEMARLIRYRARIYVESRELEPRLDFHRVSAVSAKGIKLMCSFSPSP